MKKKFTLSIAVLFLLGLPHLTFPQVQDLSFSGGLKFRPGARFEYFTRTMTWDENQQTSELKATIIALNFELQINEGFSISAIAGYSSSSYDSLVFRELPFSIELGEGDVQGYIVGVEATKSLFYAGSFEIGLTGQFTNHIGKEKIWDIADLNVSGTLTGKPNWMRVAVGPYFKVTSLGPFVPYLSVCYNYLWGKFKLEQKIQTLEGTEEKETKSKGLIDLTVGSILSLGRNFFLKGEAHVMPYGDGSDLGFVAIAAFSF